MTDKLYIRVKKDGFIYDHSERLAVHPDCEVITEAQAFPERFITPAVEDRIAVIVSTKRPNTRTGAKGAKGAKAVEPPVFDAVSLGLDLSTDISEEPVYTDPELAAEAGRGWPE
jgi:hypothetical protein